MGRATRDAPSDTLTPVREASTSSAQDEVFVPAARGATYTTTACAWRVVTRHAVSSLRTGRIYGLCKSTCLTLRWQETLLTGGRGKELRRSFYWLRARARRKGDMLRNFDIFGNKCHSVNTITLGEINKKYDF